MNTAHLLEHLATALDAGERLVWIGVAAVHGSAPRATGARMLVGLRSSFGTIGGGHLELRAIEIARGMIVDAAAGLPAPARIERFPLGASVGQCCGGVVHLAFDLVGAASRDWVDAARILERRQLAWLRTLALDTGEVQVARLDDRLARHGDAGIEACAAAFGALPADAATICTEPVTGTRHVVELVRPPELHLALFGAGHVGRALIEVLSRLPIRVTWIDPRESEFLAWTPDNVCPVITDIPEAEVGSQPPRSAVIITTHSHALDLELVRAWLDRGDFRFLGLIGSASKRASFEQRLRARGYGEAQLASIVSPVGEPAVVGKEPEVIAIAIAAQLMSLRSPAPTIQPARDHHAAPACSTP
ncbi:xanthine dehydrogenase accessory protein XdhC [Azoarcus sp. L1K30]|uniref:xanthine dehydrogenase accessory protein XdhC n=1 Tax=Azoarcus sp. L1K30 TaxID=2820277 RepID=UPI001B8385F8|nr:xanthine dehydrogenase accessory protein XdhC [Azoarcus sp. L1K30]MBR0564559.1 xanthine dehydrogenase accessory protein XdhC [Azoarcus sp. L1K30]